MGAAIRKLPRVTKLANNDVVPIGSLALGSDAQTTLATVLAWVIENYPSSGGVTEYVNLLDSQTVDLTNVNNPLAAALVQLSNTIATATAAAKDRTQQTGNMPGQNLAYASGELGEAFKARVEAFMAGVTPSAPQITTAPALTPGTPPALGATLTIVPGTVTGPASVASYQLNADGIAVPTAIFSTLSFVLDVSLASVVGKLLSITQIQDAGGGLIGRRTSATIGPVTQTLASNTGGANLPKFTQSGSVPSTTLITLNAGVWANAVSFVYYLFLNGSAAYYTSSQTAATSMASQLTAAQVGTVTMGVIAFNAYGNPHSASPLMAAAGLTVTGAAPVVEQSVIGGLNAAHVYLDQTTTLTESTFTFNGVTRAPDVLGGVTQIFHNFFKSSAPNTATRTDNIGLSFTPSSTGPDFLTAGQLVSFDSYPVFDGVRYGPFRSNAKAVEAAPATLAITLSAAAVAGLTYPSGSTITAATLATITGGSGVYSVTLNGTANPALPATLAAGVVAGPPATVQLTGNPGTPQANASLTITVNDGVNPPVISAAFNVLITNSAVTPLATLVPTNVSAYGIDTGYSGQTITGGDGAVRIQKLTSYNSVSRVGFVRRGKQGDPLIFGGVRSEFDVYSGPAAQPSSLGVDYWYGLDVVPYVGEWVGDTNDFSDQGAWFQIHQASTSLIANGPTFALKWSAGDNSMRCEGNYGTGSSQNNSRDMFNCGQDSNLVPGSHNRIIVHLRFGPDTSYAPRVEVWHAVGTGAYVKKIDLSGAAALMSGPASGGEVARTGMYKWSSTTWSGGITSRAFNTSEFFGGVGVNLFNEAAAALAAAAV